MRFFRSFLHILSICLSFLAYSVQCLSNEDMVKVVAKSPNNIIQLNDKNHKQLLGTKRDSYILVLFTATSTSVNCNVCREFEPEYVNIVKSWYQDHPNGQSNSDATKSLFFAEVNIKDVRNMPNVIKYYKIEDVPRFLLFRPGGLIDDFEKFTIQTSTSEVRVNDLLTKIRTATQIFDMKYYKPTDYSSLLWTMAITFALVFIAKKYRKLISQLLKSNVSKATLTIFFLTMMISGYMYNSIKNPRYAGVDKEGNIMYFVPGQLQAQFSIETQIIAILYGLLTVTAVGLVAAQKPLKKLLKGEKHADKIISVILPIGLALAFYILVAGFTSLYKVKQSSYPFQITKISSLFG